MRYLLCNLLILSLCVFVLAGSSFVLSQYITNCWTNSYGNEYCSYSDGSYEYRNQPWNEYYDRQWSYYHSDEYDKLQEKYYRIEEEKRKMQEAEYEYQEYKRQQQEESWKPTLEEMYGTPSLEEMYGPVDDYYTTETKKSSTSYYTCPANSTLKDWECYCNDWYFVGSSGYCVQDMQYTCNQKYPWTIYRAIDKTCICPSWNPFAWDSNTRSCPNQYIKYTSSEQSSMTDNHWKLKSTIQFDRWSFLFMILVVGVVLVVLKDIIDNK